MREKILVPCLDVIISPFSGFVLEIWSSTVFSGKRRSLLHPNTAQDFFSHYNLILRKIQEKMSRKAPPGHPIILLKSN